jgi:Uma2 family endonuclease
MTMAEFLDWEERQERKYEFDGFKPVATIDATWAHSTIQKNVLVAVGTRLRGKLGQLHGSLLEIEVAGRIRYPDAFVVCTPSAGSDKIVTDPVVIFEILSDCSGLQDRITKNEEYRLTSSVKRYVMLEQNIQAAIVFAREGERWVGTLHKGDAILFMPDIGIEVPLVEFYEGLAFTENQRSAA